MKQRISDMLKSCASIDPDADPSASRVRAVTKKYDITADKYIALAASQRGGCAICGKKSVSRKKSTGRSYLVVDHNHNTGKVRGLLCAKCNMGIGLLMDSADMLRLAAAYLDKHSD